MGKKHTEVQGVDWDALCAYVGDIQARLNLTNWSVFLDREPCARRYAGSVTPLYGRMVARINISRDWANYSPANQRHTIVHELWHLAHRPVDSVFERMADALPTKIGDYAQADYVEAMEYAVDAGATLLAEFMPLPPPFTEQLETPKS